uniref:AP2-like ethylene-responsive transcription factor TOE3 n=1 Tax=Fragaria vesca subsp. vesca TaxID=101020 RepID=UPI0005CB14BD|nr:PREDICTED: AP2-like ethylene-responsive transcription factor TOE3 [Fragaria vesca subsp. vesca]
MYDRAVIMFTGVEADINFNIEDFKQGFIKLGSLAKPQIPHSSLLIDRKFNFGFVKGRRRKVFDLLRHNIDHYSI